MPLVRRHILGVRITIPVEETIDEGDARSSPTTQEASVPLQVILTPGEVPHKVAPVHIRQLIVEEVRQVIPEGRLRHILRITSHPGIVHLGVTTLVDAREEHHPFALVDRFVLGSTCHIAVGVRRIILLHTPVGRLSVLELRAAIGSILIRSSEGRAVEERSGAVLLTCQIVAQREGVSRRILIHRRVCHGTH